MVRRILPVLAAFLLTIAVVGAGFLFWAGKRAEPDYAGDLALTGLGAPVTVRYGPHAVPTIEANSLQDLLFAQGWVVASERMWQMDLLRRLAQGQLAELLGPDALPADRFFRTIGLGRAAQASLAALEPEYREMLAAYASGVNAYQTRARGRLPLEYLLTRSEPAPWRPEDSLAVGEYMGWMLSFNVREELVFLRLAARVGNQRAMELFPVDEGIPASGSATDLPPVDRDLADAFEGLLALPARFGLPVPGAASNGWAVTGPRTQGGRALLANDPHLAPTLPSVWYQLELKSPGLHASGMTMPGVPFVLIGHNADLAWGFTTVMADLQDVFVERPVGSGKVERPEGAREPIATRFEEIRVRGRKPVEVAVRSTGHGVILNDILGEVTRTPMDLADPGRPGLLALRTNLEVPDRSLAAMHGLNRARSLDEALDASRDIRRTAFNLMAAHRDGGIAWRMTGVLPRRGRGTGAFPAPGWEPGFGWRGYSEASDNPSATDPPGYALITANNRTVPTDHPVRISSSWMAPYRAQRIEELLGSRTELTADDLAHMQLDRQSVQVRMFQKALARHGPEIRVVDPEARRIADEYLMTWDGRFEPGSRGAVLFALLRPALYEAIFGDELGEDLTLLMSIATLSYSALDAAVRDDRSSFWDDQRTARTEGPAHAWAAALRRAKDELVRDQPQLGAQRLDRLLSVTFPHAFHRIPLVGRLFDVGPIPTGGDEHTVNVMKAQPLNPGEAIYVPTFRAVFTPGDWVGTRGILALGQSGHRFSPYRADQLDDWLAGRTRSWPWGGPRSGTELGMVVLRPEAAAPDAG